MPTISEDVCHVVFAFPSEQRTAVYISEHTPLHLHPYAYG